MGDEMMEEICLALRYNYFNVFYTFAAMEQIVITTYIINSYTPKMYIYVQKPLSKDTPEINEEKEKLYPVILHSSILHNQSSHSRWYHFCPSSNVSPQTLQSLIHPEAIQPIIDHPYSSSTSRPYTLAYHPTLLAPRQIYSHPHPSP